MLKIKYLVFIIQTKKTGYNTKINETEKRITDHNQDKYITTSEFNKWTRKNFAARSKQANLASKSNIADFVNMADIDNKLRDITSNKNELNKLSKKLKQYQQKD